LLTIFSSGTQEVMGAQMPACILQVRSVAFTPDGKTIFSSCDHALVAWDLETQEKRSDFQFWGGTGNVFTLSLDGKLLINGEEDGKIDIWEIASGKRLAEQLGHESEITSLVFSPDGSLLASASRDGTVVLWDTQSWSRLATLEASARSVAFSPDGNFLVTDAYRPGGQLWGVRSVSLTAKRTGVTVVLLAGGTYLEPWKKHIPTSWLVTEGSFPRYEIRITSAWVVEQSCRYGEGAFHFLERRQSTVNVEVVDLENDKIVAQKVFEGELPPACPEKHVFSATNLTDYSDGPAPDITPFEPWLKETMAKLGYH